MNAFQISTRKRFLPQKKKKKVPLCVSLSLFHFLITLCRVQHTDSIHYVDSLGGTVIYFEKKAFNQQDPIIQQLLLDIKTVCSFKTMKKDKQRDSTSCHVGIRRRCSRKPTRTYVTQRKYIQNFVSNNKSFFQAVSTPFLFFLKLFLLLSIKQLKRDFFI